jgi:hypothetical protein
MPTHHWRVEADLKNIQNLWNLTRPRNIHPQLPSFSGQRISLHYRSCDEILLFSNKKNLAYLGTNKTQGVVGSLEVKEERLLYE